MSRLIFSQTLSAATTLVAALALTGCTALDKQYHAFTDHHEHGPALMQAGESGDTAESDETELAEVQDAETESKPVPSGQVDGIALRATSSQSITSNNTPENADWRYHPDSRDEYLAAQESAEESNAGRVWQDPLITGYQPDRTHKALNDYAAQLAMNLMSSAKTLSSHDLVGVASFVRLNRTLQETTVVGNQLSELLIAELQGAGVGIVDFKMAGSLTVTPQGDLAMTRSGEALSRQLEMDHILTGTLIEEPRGVRVNARIVAVKSGQVVGSSTLLVPAFMVAQLNSPAY